MLSRIQNFYAFLAIIAIFSSLTIVGCKKENAVGELTDAQMLEIAKQTLVANKMMDNSVAVATSGMTKVNGFTNNEEPILITRVLPCVPPTVAPLDLFTYPKTVSFNYGEGCQDADGKLKSGAVTIKVGQLLAVGSSVEATYNNYTENGNKLNGKFTITNNGTVGAFNMDVVADNITMTSVDGRSVNYTMRQTVRQISGLGNFNLNDDVYEVTNSLSSTLPDGTKVTWQSTTPLKKAAVCEYVQKGLALMTVNGILPMTVDFGNDTCDNKATVTIGTNKYEINL